MKIYRFHYTIRIDTTDYIFLMSVCYYNDIPVWHVQIYHVNGDFLEDKYFSDYSPRAAWKSFYHIARHDDWYGNGR